MTDDRQVEISKPLSLAGGLALRMAQLIRMDETLSDADKMGAYRNLPRNRAEARKYLRGNGPYGLAKRRP